ncbi:concanavalin A-like lectin/glucanase [Diplogelasinospora grovesii]|uniref:chitinase n=1 Tax=Diplogelasinospora grovesii TaxID=303347 RepID=A0AAN6MWS2_9PEZI|nr:concanavalin A-like lectin/glucanase [Diplogelasinospora grovesii]
MHSSRSFIFSAIALLSQSILIQHVAAQVTTSCQPLNTTNCPADPAFGMDYTFHFNQTPTDSTWETTAGKVTYDVNNGATFTINKQGDSPTIRTNFYFFFGRAEVWLKTAPGTGIISSIMMLSDDLDEIDWEFMGGNDTHAETNYFGKGVQDYHNAIYYPVQGGVQDDYHNYTTVWTNSSLDYYIDNEKVRTLLPKDANNTYYYPQTPMRLSIGIWAGGDPTLPQGTREWAGGDTDYSKGPFTMYVKTARVADYSSGKEYSYGDMSGSWQSIKITAGNSTVKEAINAPPAQTLADKWNAISPTAKVAIYASAAGVGAALVAWALFYCIRQRRRGAREARLAEAKAEEERLELERFKKAGVNPDSFVDEASEYNAEDMHRDGLSGKNSYSVPTSPAIASPVNEKWGAGAGLGAAGAGAMRSPMPLLRDGAQSPRVTSPGSDRSPFNAPYSDRAVNSRSPAPNVGTYEPSRSPAPTIGMTPPSPATGAPPQPFPQPASRSFSSPAAQMRVGSPGPQQPGYGGVQRMASPSPMAQPQPQRSFTTGGYGGHQFGHDGQGGGYGSGDGGAYWGNGGYR